MSLVFPHTFVPWFRAVAPYIHAYRGKTFVVGLVGEAVAAGKLSVFVQDLAILHAMGVKLVLVHGFRPQVNEQLAAKGHVSRFHRGVRVTDAVALDAAQEAAGQLRFEIEAAFSQGLPNTPMANATVRVVSGNFLTARPVGIVDGVDMMHSGVVRRVDQAAIRRAIDNDGIVLLSPFGFSPTGEAFNLTMEDVATATAVALRADKLVFMTEMPGIREHAAERPDDASAPIDTARCGTTSVAGETALETGTISKIANWRMDPSISGVSNCMGDIGTHAHNLARYITGLEIEEICAELSTFIPGRLLDDDGNCLVRFSGGVKGILFASQISSGEENNLNIRVFGTKGSLQWFQENPNELLFKKADAPQQVHRRGNGYHSDAAKGAIRTPFAHPEGFIEAFANIYRSAAVAIADSIEGRKAPKSGYDFPTIDDGLAGMAFIETAVKSGKAGARWMKFPKI